MNYSEQLFKRALSVIPGGVNSPVRAFNCVGMTPRFIAKAKGSRITDADNIEYIDYVCSWGAMILGHNREEILESVIHTAEKGLSFGAATEAEVEMAEFICGNVPAIEKIRMVNSGTEAVMSAIRAARGFTGRNKIVKFEGCYHGHSDSLLVRAGSGLMTEGIPGSAGVPENVTRDTLSASYNNLNSVEKLFQLYPEEIAAVIVEPIAANMGVVLPRDGFLEGLQQICRKYGAVFILDEVITGFRLGFTGAQGYFGLKPDLITYGKIIGAGMPVGAYGGRKEIMDMVSPIGPVYQAGTLSGNPVAMRAGLTQLRLLKSKPEIYSHLENMAAHLFNGMSKIMKQYGKPYTVNHIGSIGTVFFTNRLVYDYNSAKTCDTRLFADHFAHMLRHQIYMAPSQYEAIFLSAAHNDEDIEKTLDVFQQEMA